MAKLIEAIHRNNLSEANLLVKQILLQKIQEKLEDKKQEVTVNMFSEGEVKDKNKKHKKEIEKRIERNMEKSHGGGVTGRLLSKILPSDTIKSLSRKPKETHWTSKIGLYRPTVTEDE